MNSTKEEETKKYDDEEAYRSQQTDDSRNVVQEEENNMPLSNINAESNNNDNGDDDDDDSKPKDEKQVTFMEQASSKALRPFVIISSSYLLYTITDGAIRMIVLLQAYKLNFSALEVAIMFSLYELAGVFTNLVSQVKSKSQSKKKKKKT
jgi:sugar phosphate permease